MRKSGARARFPGRLFYRLLDPHVLALDETGFAEALAEGGRRARGGLSDIVQRGFWPDLSHSLTHGRQRWSPLGHQWRHAGAWEAVRRNVQSFAFNFIKWILYSFPGRLHTNAATWSETQLPFCTRRHPRRTLWTLPCAGAKRDAGRPIVLNCRRARRRSRHTPLLNSQSNPSGQFG